MVSTGRIQHHPYTPQREKLYYPSRCGVDAATTRSMTGRWVTRRMVGNSPAVQQKRRPGLTGLLSKSNCSSRISAQHHCCNGKSIQCPSNIITSSGHYLCGLLLYSIVLTLIIMPIPQQIANRHTPLSANGSKCLVVIILKPGLCAPARFRSRRVHICAYRRFARRVTTVSCYGE